MSNLYIIDLKSARLRTGLLQSDCAHLLGVSSETYSQLETGKRQPQISEICALTYIFSQTFESLFRQLDKGVRQRLRSRLESMPPLPESSGDSEQRQTTLSSLREYLMTLNAVKYDA